MLFDYSKRTTIDDRYRTRQDDQRTGWNDNYQSRIDRIKEILVQYPIPQSSKVLELGCGAGNIALYLAEQGYESFGIDLSSVAISWAEEKKKELGLTATFLVGNVVELTEYTQECFDLVVDGDCLWMIIGADRKDCLSNISRILKPNGLLIANAKLLNEDLQTRYYINPDNIFDPKLQCLTQDGIPYYYLSREKEFIAELDRAGFKVLETKTFPPKHNEHPLIAGSLSAVARKQA
jgi:2-polyprenyl-3-methyl-5-hydroxy-6-metoxy-1,4-benzoquinol methylase